MLPQKNRLKIGEFFGKNAPKPENIIKKTSFSFKIYKTDKVVPRFGVVLSASLDKKSVVRNKIKRAIFDFIHENIKKFPPADYLFFPSKKMTTLKRNEIINLLNNELSF